MFTTWEQIESWITDNGFKRWIFYRDSARTEKIVDSGAFTVSDQRDKLDMTEKYLRMSGGRAYASGFANNGTNDATVCEIRLESEAPVNGAGMMQPAMPDEDAIARRVEAKLRAEYEKKEYEKLRADLDKERAAFEAEKASALGALAHYFAPIGQAILGQQQHRLVAGVDTEEPVHAKPIVPEQPETEEQEETSPFTDEEADKLFELMARFKAVEPDYMKLIEAVVKMAESGNPMYGMAKKSLLG